MPGVSPFVSNLRPVLRAVALAPLAVAALAGEPRVAVTAQEPMMRVLVAEAQTLQLRADAALPLRVRGLGGQERSLQRLSVSLRGGSLLLDGLGQAPSLRVSTDDPRGLWLGQRRYRGDVLLLPRGGRVLAINRLGIETYLPSVVGSEMPASWPLPALQAQAVAARTYALRQRGKKGDFDVKATVASQVYKGVESETPRTREAVDTTRSLVLVHGGRLINAVFHSSSGGATEPSGEVWRQQLPYLVSVRDHDDHSPVHRWNKRFDGSDLQRLFKETGGVETVRVLSTSSTGRVRSARIQGPRGALVLSGRELRQRLGLKSTMVRFAMVSDGDRELSPARPLDSEPARARPALIGLWSDSASGSSEAADPGLAPPPPPPPPLQMPLTLSNHDRPNSHDRPNNLDRSNSLVLEAQGQGYGHGVGMSQWGAHGLAEQGADFRQILLHYYRGVQIRPYRPSDDPSLAFSPGPEPAWWG